MDRSLDEHFMREAQREAREALAVGVEAFAYNCRVSERAIDLSRRLPIQL